MLQTLLAGWKKSDWAKAADFLSPAFFDVVPTLAMTKIVAQLSKHSLDAGYAQKVADQWAPRLKDWEPAVSFGKAPPAAPSVDGDAGVRGATLLKLYFASLLFDGPCYLDLRFGQFAGTSPSQILWSPKPWIHDFSKDFRRSILRVYRGFYEDQPALFSQGLQALGLEHSHTLFLTIFGSVKTQPMLFKLADFRASFHQIFVACKEHKTTLHPEFLPLGLLLFSLYEHAEALGTALNPGTAWQELSRKHPWEQTEQSW